MKHLLFFLTIFICVGLFGQAEEEYKNISGSKKVKVRGFAGPMMLFTSIGDDFAFMMGGNGGLMVGNFYFGGYGVGQTTEMNFPKDPTVYESGDKMTFSHGGLMFGYIIKPKMAIHPNLQFSTGWGSIDKVNDNEPFMDADGLFKDNVFVISPTLELEANVSRFFRTGIGVNYTHVFLIDAPYYSPIDFSNYGIYLSFKFGWFD